MASDLRDAVLKTLSYAAVFEYPLTLLELHTYLIGEQVEWKSFKQQVKKIPEIEFHREFIVLKGNERFVAKRLKRQKISQRHWRENIDVVRLLGKIPSIQGIGISGSLAMSNSTERSDVDLLMITSPNALWMTRVIVTGLLWIVGKKRSQASKDVTNKICTNMWMSENVLMIHRKNLFTAHEVTQLKVVVNKNKLFERFFLTNKWVEKYLPQTDMPKPVNLKLQSPVSRLFIRMLGPCEWLAYQIQRMYMSKKRTTENVSPTGASFHPQDVTYTVLQKYKNIYKRYRAFDDFKAKNRTIRYRKSLKYSGILT